jgi:polysaccharide biosynthesis PFTS motif protein
MMALTWKRHMRATLRRAMRSYRRFRDTDRLATTEKVVAQLAATQLPVRPSKLFYGAAMPQAELATRQYLYLRQVLYRLPQILLAQVGSPAAPLVYPLPRQWQDILISSGFAVDRLRCSLLWVIVVLLYWGYGVFSIARLLASTAVASLGGRYHTVGEFSHFEHIGVAQTPRPAPDGRSFDVMSWYRQWKGRALAVERLSYRVKSPVVHRDRDCVLPLQTPFLPILTGGGWLRFVGWSVAAISLSFLDMMRGRWWHPLLLSEAVLAALAHAVPANGLACDYLFNNSGWLYRPLWTYEAEKRGSRILFYHYSTNSAAFRREDGYPPEHCTWPLTNWPLHLVWNDNQADFVRRAVGHYTLVDVVGPILFSSSPDALPEIAHPSIAVFDVQPFRASGIPALATEFIYYTAETCTAFVRDVARVCAETGNQMVWKRKRSIGKMAHPKYRNLADELDRTRSALVVSPDHSAIRVIEACDAVISMPFTSTALLGRQMGKPSCYYDPSGLIHKDDRGAHDIPLLQGNEELAAWVRSLQSTNAPTMDIG